MNSAKQIKLANLKAALDDLVNNYDAHPSRSNYWRIVAVRSEIAEVATA